MDFYSMSDLATSPMPKTAIDKDSSFEETPAKKRVKLSPELTKCFDENLSATITLVLKNNEELTLERSVLSFYSTYFRTLFSSDFQDSKTSRLRLPLISSPDLRYLIAIPRAFENNMRPEIGAQRASDLLEPAAYLGMETALDYLTTIISKHLTEENIIRIFRRALLYHTPLALEVWRAMIRNFQAMFFSNTYLLLEENELIALLSDKHLNLRSVDEKSVVENWRRANFSESLGDIQRFSQKNFARKPIPDSTKYEVIRNRQPSSAIVSFGGWASRGIAQKIEVFNNRCDRWQTCNFDYDIPGIRRAYNGIQLVDNDQLVVYGGFDGPNHFQTTLVFDLNTKNWKSGMNMHEKRCYITGATIVDSYRKELIVACGGMNGAVRTSTVELYDVRKDRWTEVGSMKKARSDGGTVTVGNKVLYAGGFDGRIMLESCEIYDPVVDVWTSISPSMKTRRTGCSAVSISNDTCIVMGGFNGNRRLESCEMYDVREGIWHHIPQMLVGRSNFGACHDGMGSVYVAGGYDGQKTTMENERFDWRSRSWQALPDLHEAKSALRLVQLSDHPFLDELFEIADDEVLLD